MHDDHENMRRPDVKTGDEPEDRTEPDEKAESEEDSGPVDPNAGLGLDEDGILRIRPRRRTIPVEADFGDEGKVKKYTIVQMNGLQKGDYEEYNSRQAVYTKRGAFKELKRGAVKESNAELISRCLYFDQWLNDPKQDRRVPKDVIMTWGAEAIESLARVCEKLNCVGREQARYMQEADETAKKD